MGVYAKEMKTPKTCFDCIKSGLQKIVGCTEWKNTTAGIRERCRIRFCPLVEIQEPHGRLIDGDELKTAFPRCDNSTPVLVASVRATINHAPTVIESEGE